MWFRGVCVPNFRSVSYFVWPGGVTHKRIPTYTSENRNILDRLLASRGLRYVKSEEIYARESRHNETGIASINPTRMFFYKKLLVVGRTYDEKNYSLSKKMFFKFKCI